MSERDIRTDPHVGDVVQVYPALSLELPAPLTVTRVHEIGIRWYREGQGHCSTGWPAWSGKDRRVPCPPSRLELLREADI